MIQSVIKWFDGNKTYLCVVGWMVYKFGVTSAYWMDTPEIELTLLGGAGLALRKGMKKAEK